MNRNTTKSKLFVALGGAVLALAFSSASMRTAYANSSAAGRAAEDNASVTGKVSFTGTPPKRAVLNMSADPVCAGEHTQPVRAPDG